MVSWLLVFPLLAAGAPSETLESRLLSEDPTALAAAVRAQGDPARGAILFHQPYLACTRCHATGDGSNGLGPDLAQLGKDTTTAHLIESILLPSKTVKKGFETISLATSDGRTVSGLLLEERDDAIVLRDPAQDGKPIRVSRVDIEARNDQGPSIMPAGLVNALTSRAEFLDLVRYLREIADGGPERARALRPAPASLAGGNLPDYERDIDHAGMIAALGRENLRRGREIYERVCSNCHGTKDRPGSMPTSLQFASGRFKNGSDPYRMYQTLTRGYGQMPPQSWMVPKQKYDVIHYIRETFLKADNPTQFVPVDRDFLAGLPRGRQQGPEPSKIERWSAMDYGPTLTATYEVGDDGSNFAYKGVAIRLDAGPGGIARGRAWSVFEHDTMRWAAGWSGAGFIDWNGINFNGRHEIHPRLVGRVHWANPNGPGWANPRDGSFDDPRPRGRDGKAYGPLPRSWAHYLGQYRHGDRVVLSYSVGNAVVLESPGLESSGDTTVFTRSFRIGPRDRPMILQVAHEPGPDRAVRLVEPLEGADAAAAVLGPAATPSGGAAPAAPLRFRGGVYLDVARPDDFDLTGADFSITARIQTTRGGTLFCETAPVEEWVPNGKALFVRDGRLVFDIGWVGAVESRRKVDDGLWHDVAMAYGHATGRVGLYVDGRPDREGTLVPRGRLANRVVRIGFAAPDFPEPTTYFDGRIASLSAFQAALSPEEIADARNRPDRPDARLVARWHPESSLRNLVADASGRGHDARVIGGTSADEDAGLLACLSPATPGAAWKSTPGGDLRLAIPAGDSPLRFTLKLARLPRGADAQALATSLGGGLPIDLDAMIRGGPTQWPQAFETRMQAGPGDGPFAVDTFGLPENNPWLCQMRLSGLDFLDQGRRAAVCTWDGDVWLVDGLTAPSGTLSWRRIASGLFQPLGLKVRDGRIYVGCRDQIVVLRDLNGDGETDFYEDFNSDHQVTDHFHEFAMGLQTDASGNFYYAKAARHGKTALVPQHGTLLRVSRDGRTTEILATGFRAPNGVCVNDDGTFFLTDQEGFWTPKNRINWVKVGGFYGNMWGYHDVTDPSDAAMVPPVCWITNAMDRSPGEVVRVDSPAWGPLRGSLLNLSYGTGKLFVVPHEVVEGVMQGGVCALPIPPLPTGVMRGRFHPEDGQLYCCGMFAWAGNQTASGGLYRIRATGHPMWLPIGLGARKGRIEITFTDPIDSGFASDLSHYAVKTWSLRRTEDYGSPHYDEKPLRVAEASVTNDGRTLSLLLPGIQPTWSMEIKYTLSSARGETIDGLIHNTIHKLRD